MTIFPGVPNLNRQRIGSVTGPAGNGQGLFKIRREGTDDIRKLVDGVVDQSYSFKVRCLNVLGLRGFLFQDQGIIRIPISAG